MIEATGTARPAVGRALDQAVQQPEHGYREQAGAPAVDDGGPVAVVVTRQDLDGHDQPDDAKDDVDEEDRAPGQTEQVGADDEPGQDRAADTGETENRAEQPERLGEHVAVERFRHDRHALRDEQRPERSLSNPGGDEQGRVRREPGDRRGQGEPAHADQESLRWPNLSPSRPPTTSRTPMASMYAGPSHLIRLSPPWSSPAMVGAATRGLAWHPSGVRRLAARDRNAPAGRGPRHPRIR